MLPSYVNRTTITAIAINIILMAAFFGINPELTILAPIAVMLGYALRWDSVPAYYTGGLGTLVFMQVIIIMLCCMFELTPL